MKIYKGPNFRQIFLFLNFRPVRENARASFHQFHQRGHSIGKRAEKQAKLIIEVVDKSPMERLSIFSPMLQRPFNDFQPTVNCLLFATRFLTLFISICFSLYLIILLSFFLFLFLLISIFLFLSTTQYLSISLSPFLLLNTFQFLCITQYLSISLYHSVSFCFSLSLSIFLFVSYVYV